jgi:multidrug efflux system outer membrane protein
MRHIRPEINNMKRYLFLLLIVVAFFAAGCTMIPKYHRPEAPVPDKWPSGPAYKQAPQKARAVSEIPWRQFFTDERIQTVIASALENNRDLRVAALNVERARALYRIQRAELLPAIDASASGSRERKPAALSNSGSPQTTDLYRADLGISYWEIDFFGRIRSLEKSALEQYFATEQARRSAQILLVSEVANAYLTLAADREDLQLAQSTLATQQAVHRLIKRRFDTGISSELDLRQAQTQVDAARVDVAFYRQLAARDKNALDLLVGSSVPADLLPEALSSVTPLPDVSPGTTSEALLSRPDILQAENLLKAANANIGAARAAFFPRIALTTSVGTVSNDLSGLFDSGTGAWNYGAQIVMPIFDARTLPALKASKVDKEIAVAQYEKAIQSAFREVADALAQRGTIEDQMNAQQSLVDATFASYQLANARYTKGIDTYLNALVAQRALYVSQQGLISTRLSKLANQVRLYEVLGGGGDSETRKD